MPLNSILFYFRVRAVFHHSKIICGIFGLLWLSTLSCFSDLSAVQAIHIGTTNVCIEVLIKQSLAVGMVVIAVHDTLVYLAISTRLTIISNWASPRTSSLAAILRGRGLGHVTRTLLQSGQMYYLTTVSMNIVAMIAVLSPSFPQVYKAMLLIPNVAIQNAMACRVYRQLKLGFITTPTIPSGTPTSIVTLPSPFSASSGDGSTVISTPLPIMDSPKELQLLRNSTSGRIHSDFSRVGSDLSIVDIC